MPRFFFDLRCRTQLFPDTEGEMVPDLAGALDCARVAARELASEPSPLSTDWSECIFEIRDEAGRLVSWFPFFDALGPGTPL